MTVIGRCRQCNKRRETYPARRAGGGNYRRPHRNIRSSICLSCATELLAQLTPGHHSVERWDLSGLRYVVEIAGRKGSGSACLSDAQEEVMKTAKKTPPSAKATTASTTIGDSVWVFDENRRVYTKPANGKIYSSGPPIWREHWRQMWIIGETNRSWILGWVKNSMLQSKSKNMAVDKKGLTAGTARCMIGGKGRAVLRYAIDVERAAWVYDHRHTVAERVRAVQDPSALAAIAVLASAAVPPLPGPMPSVLEGETCATYCKRSGISASMMLALMARQDIAAVTWALWSHYVDGEKNGPVRK